MNELFLGVDAGGTTTRALVANAGGGVVGAGRAGGANVWSSGTSVSQVIASAVSDALADVDPSRIVTGVVALAGNLTGDDMAAEVAAAWQSLDLASWLPHVVSDVLAGFATGSTAADGTVLVAGTGSIAAAIRDRDVSRTSGGHGWLLGDEGSAVWLGLQGIRAALRALDGRGPDSLLADNIATALGIIDPSAVPTTVRIVRGAHDRPPAALGKLAPVVVDAAAQGDPVAEALVDAAIGHLVELVEAVIDEEGRGIIVLTGSLLTESTPIGRSVRTSLHDRWPTATLAESGSGEAGAVALAIERYRGTGIDETALARLREASAALRDAR
jgi:N-acetylglucosamine kinase-like BadF-type ATPase